MTPRRGMPLNTTYWGQDLDNAIADLPDELFYDGKWLPCSTNDLGLVITFGDAVESKQRNVIVTANLKKFPSEPKPERKCSLRRYGNRSTEAFIVESVSIASDGNQVSLTLRANQGAGTTPA